MLLVLALFLTLLIYSKTPMLRANVQQVICFTEFSTNNIITMFGFYEKRLCLLLFISAIPDAFESLQVLTMHFKPDFVCSDNRSIMQQVFVTTVRTFSSNFRHV